MARRLGLSIRSRESVVDEHLRKMTPAERANFLGTQTERRLRREHLEQRKNMRQAKPRPVDRKRET